MEPITFQRALEKIEPLPDDQGESLMEIVKNRFMGEGRVLLAK